MLAKVSFDFIDDAKLVTEHIYSATGNNYILLTIINGTFR